MHLNDYLSQSEGQLLKNVSLTMISLSKCKKEYIILISMASYAIIVNDLMLTMDNIILSFNAKVSPCFSLILFLSRHFIAYL